MDYTTSITVTTKFMDALQNLNGLFKKKSSVRNNNLQLLEPLTTIVRLAILRFQDIGTKIAIYNNRIASQSPNLIQGAIRWTYGNKRNELHNLYKPILISTKYYDRTTDENIKTIFNFAVDGLENLALTYSEHENDIVCHSIKLYKDILSSNAKNKKHILQQINEDDVTLPLYEQFSALWDEDQISIIASLLKEAAKPDTEGHVSIAFLQAVDRLLQDKENASVKIINTFTLNLTKS